MMKLSQMKKVRDSVDEKTWRSPAGDTFARLWPHDPDSVRFWRISSNAMFLVNVDGQRHFLRFNLAAERSLSEVETEIRILRALDGSPVRAAQPIPSLAGRLVETAEWNGDVYHAVFFEGMPGDHPDDEDLSEQQGFRWGNELGRLHAQTALMPGSVFDGRGDWRRDIGRMRQLLIGETPVIRTALETAAAEMESICAHQAAVLIHFDFEMDNLLWQENGIGIIDFDDCRIYPPGADIEYAIRSLRKSSDPASLQLIQAFLNGYASSSPYPLPSRKELDLFRQWHRLYLLAASRRELDIPADEPRVPWQADLEGRFAALAGKLRSEIEDYAAQDST